MACRMGGRGSTLAHTTIDGYPYDTIVVWVGGVLESESESESVRQIKSDGLKSNTSAHKIYQPTQGALREHVSLGGITLGDVSFWSAHFRRRTAYG